MIKFVCEICSKELKTYHGKIIHKRMAHGQNPMKRPEVVKRNVEARKKTEFYQNGGGFGKVWSEDREKMLKIVRSHMVGSLNPMKNPETAKKCGKTLHKKYLTYPHPGKGKKRSQEYIEKMRNDKQRWKKVSKTLTGRKHTKEHVGKYKKWLLTEEGLKYKENLSDRMEGKNNPNWRGGTWKNSQSYNPGFTGKLKEKVRIRDNKKCVLCEGTRLENSGRRLSVHHIDFDQQNNKIENLVSLCMCCHNFVEYNQLVVDI